MSCQNSRARWKIRETFWGPPVKSTNHHLSNWMPRLAYPKVSLMKRRPAVDLRAVAWKHIGRSGGKRSNSMFPVRLAANSEPRPRNEQGNAGLGCLLDTCNIASGADSVGRPWGRTSPVPGERQAGGAKGIGRLYSHGYPQMSRNQSNNLSHFKLVRFSIFILLAESTLIAVRYHILCSSLLQTTSEVSGRLFCSLTIQQIPSR